MSKNTKGIAALLAAHGRNGDTELLHVSKGELHALDKLGRPHGIQLTTNPQTGLKEAFNWQSTLGGVAGGIAGAFLTAPTGGLINPYTGAALGSAAGTKLAGGSNQDALMNGVISGVTAWGMGGVSDALASAGKDVAQEGVKAGVEEGVKTGVQEGVTQTALPGAANAFGDSGAAVISGPNAFAGSGGLPSGAAPVTTAAAPPATVTLPDASGQGFAPFGGDTTVQAFATPEPGSFMPDIGTYGAENIGSQGVNTYTSQGTKEMVAAGANPNVTSSVAPGANTVSASGTNPDYWSNVGKGLGSLDTPGKAGEFAVANKGSLMATGIGAAMAYDAPGDYSQSTDTGTVGPDLSLPSTEVYYTPYGERRTRVVGREQYGNVNMAEGGMAFSDYDAADAAADGGYAPGGVARYGIGGDIRNLQPGGALGDWHGQMYGTIAKATGVDPGGTLMQLTPGYNQYHDKKKEEEERKAAEEKAGIAAAAAAKEKAEQKAAFESQWSQRYGVPVAMAANGGLTQHFEKGGVPDLGGDYLEHPAAKYMRRAEFAGQPIVDKGVRGGAGRVGYNMPVGERGNLNAGISGMGMQTRFPGADPVTRGRVTGADLTYSMPDRSISARYDAMAPTGMPSYGGGYSAADLGRGPSEAQMMGAGMSPMARDRFSVNYRQNFAEGGLAGLGQLLGGQNGTNPLAQYGNATLTGPLGNNAAGTGMTSMSSGYLPSGVGFEGGTIGDGITPSNPAMRTAANIQQNYAPVTQAPQVQQGASSLLGYNSGGGGMQSGGAQGTFPLEGRYGITKMAGGGLSDLGHYSDGGNLLRGPGDGVSDSIPASIEGKRPARLANGEFVIPARAVSELGNGSTEAGSKQLYAMLDRIAKKRKKGKGLAYEANPKKMMPA